MDLSKTGPGPFKMTVQGRNANRMTDVLVGEVWLASGQSNMQWPLNQTLNGDKEIAAAGKVLLNFTQAAGGLLAQPLPATHDVRTVAPVAVRYAWADNPTGNLFNGASLPASPFRTDDFPATTRDAKS